MDGMSTGIDSGTAESNRVCVLGVTDIILWSELRSIFLENKLRAKRRQPILMRYFYRCLLLSNAISCAQNSVREVLIWKNRTKL